ncbi:MAG: tRNA (N6-isopentenyl adenosine(37)-C2)-methylthiotransferase MiaB [Endomicrobium sp.]|jgi:tRNA-2-methylthio-N6-dimethylallyladenosine synthase|nr:tRNA (N6-isopentenyl adenosine(37)-C2)-methylthiotransferase MiaB [Endomicrobium sp.]
MKFFIETIGCQMNICDSDAVSLSLLTFGADKVNALVDADVAVLNTCSVRAQAEHKAYSWLGRAEELKAVKKDLKIIVIGCMAQRLGDKITKRFKSVDLVIGAKDIEEAAKKIIELQNKNSKAQKTDARSGKPDADISDFSLKLSTPSANPVRYLTIMRGCDNYCSYCVVPFVRGNEISLNCEDILKQCEIYAENGTKEIKFLGQNVNSYNYGGINFAALLEKASEIEKISRIRFMTNHPKDLSQDLIDAIASLPKVCNHIHLPMQSASDKILQSMNRKYTYSHYRLLVEQLRKKIPDINITTDIITGFPQETQEDFQATLRAVKDIRFGGAYIFRYSPRPNTAAAAMSDDVPIEEKKRRLQILLDETNKISAEIAASAVGRRRLVLAEKCEDGVLETRTKDNRKVFVKGSPQDIGKEIDVLIAQAKINSLFGEICK